MIGKARLEKFPLENCCRVTDESLEDEGNNWDQVDSFKQLFFNIPHPERVEPLHKITGRKIYSKLIALTTKNNEFTKPIAMRSTVDEGQIMRMHTIEYP